MKRRGSVRYLTVVVFTALLSVSLALAEDTKGKWQFGFGLSYFSTTDYIRSNADLAFSNGVVGPNGLPGVGNVDPRPDGNILNQPSIQDDFRFDARASYGLTRWLAVELATAYQKSPVGNIEVFTSNSTQPVGVPSPSTLHLLCGPVLNYGTNAADPGAVCQNYNLGLQDTKVDNGFLPVGQITEIPVQLSGVVRFRPESPFDPYIGLGIGYMFNKLQTGRQFNDQAAQVSDLHVVFASEGEFTDPGRPDKLAAAPGFVPGPLQAKVGNSFEWHAVGGVDYYINEHFSFYVDARYSWTSGAIDIRTDGAHQVQFGILDPGQLQLRQTNLANDPNPYLWEDVGLHDTLGAAITCNPNDPSNPPGMRCYVPDPTLPNNGRVGWNDRLFETEDKNLNGTLDQQVLINDSKCGPSHTGENDGCIYVFPPGPLSSPNQRFDDLTFLCPQCIQDLTKIPAGTIARPATEDLNFNYYMDRFLLYGVDVCTTQQGAGSPACAHQSPSPSPLYVWPEGCPLTRPSLPGVVGGAEGCPPPPASAPAQLTTSSSDNVSDTVLIQGGRIKLNGFGLGFGFKFTF